MPRIALVTARAARGTDHDMPALLTALRTLGADAVETDWDDVTVDWASFDLALLRSPWDYVARYDEFTAWAARVAVATNLLNPLDVVRWNTDKHYLQVLADAGVATVPSHFVEPGERPDHALQTFLRAYPESAELVIKPAIGAGSRDARRHARNDVAASHAHLADLLDSGRSAVLQPYLERVDELGETSLLFFDGTFSHAIRKGPLLHRGAAATTELYATEDIDARMASADEHALAIHALAAIPFRGSLLYARVDMLRADDGSPRLLELELAEPSLFFAQSAGSAERFARAVLARCD